MSLLSRNEENYWAHSGLILAGYPLPYGGNYAIIYSHVVRSMNDYFIWRRLVTVAEQRLPLRKYICTIIMCSEHGESKKKNRRLKFTWASSVYWISSLEAQIFSQIPDHAVHVHMYA